MGGKGFIGVFDSGYGGLTVLNELRKRLPQYDYIYLGDNARAPYGNRSFDVVHDFTLEAVRFLYNKGCRLVILACNTSSAKALRTIQQRHLKEMDPSFRVLGVIRPSTETIGSYSKTKHIGILGTDGTSMMEIEPFTASTSSFIQSQNLQYFQVLEDLTDEKNHIYGKYNNSASTVSENYERKIIVKDIIHRHLGWLVVWGGVIGFLIGLILSILGNIS